MTHRLAIAALVVAAPALAAPVLAAQDARSAPRTVVMRAEALARSRNLLANGDTMLQPALKQLRHDADAALLMPLVAVTDKRTLLPPSGNAHDYFSLSPYWWPDPSKADGLPYIRRDGETNPESKKDLDQPRIDRMGKNVSALALAYHFTGDERYARRAGEQLRTWFLDSASRMTPHLRFSQLVRGNPKERGSGIIDTRWFIDAVDASTLLVGSSSWSVADQSALREWMTAYLEWLRTSDNGMSEQKARNNHGSWYAAQTAALAAFTGDTALARRIASDARARIGWQFKADGTQPLELERTRSMHYSNFNLEALTRLAEIGRPLGVDLWSYQAPEGGSLRRGIDLIARYAPEPAKWPGPQIDSISPSEVMMVLRRAQYAWGQRAYTTTLDALGSALVRADRSSLLYVTP